MTGFAAPHIVSTRQFLSTTRTDVRFFKLTPAAVKIHVHSCTRMAADMLNGAQLMGVLAQDTSRYLQKCQDLSRKTIITFPSPTHKLPALSYTHTIFCSRPGPSQP